MNEQGAFCPQVETVELERMRFGLQQSLSRSLMISKVGVEYDQMLDAVVAKLEAFVYGRALGHQEVSYPADWWQALKERWFPPWAKRRWPTKMTRVVMRAVAFYPTLRYDVPGHKAVIAILKEHPHA